MECILQKEKWRAPGVTVGLLGRLLSHPSSSTRWKPRPSYCEAQCIVYAQLGEGRGRSPRRFRLFRLYGFAMEMVVGASLIVSWEMEMAVRRKNPDLRLGLIGRERLLASRPEREGSRARCTGAQLSSKISRRPATIAGTDVSGDVVSESSELAGCGHVMYEAELSVRSVVKSYSKLSPQLRRMRRNSISQLWPRCTNNSLNSCSGGRTVGMGAQPGGPAYGDTCAGQSADWQGWGEVLRRHCMGPWA